MDNGSWCYFGQSAFTREIDFYTLTNDSFYRSAMWKRLFNFKQKKK